MKYQFLKSEVNYLSISYIVFIYFPFLVAYFIFPKVKEDSVYPHQSKHPLGLEGLNKLFSV